MHIFAQGYAAQAVVDRAYHVIIAADAIGSGSEQSMLLPRIEKTAPYREAHTLITADSGYHSDASVDKLKLGHTGLGKLNKVLLAKKDLRDGA